MRIVSIVGLVFIGFSFSVGILKGRALAIQGRQLVRGVLVQQGPQEVGQADTVVSGFTLQALEL